LLTKHLTGEWLAPEHVVESATLWLTTNGGGADVIQRVMLSSRALEVAQRMHDAPFAGLPPQAITTLFSENLRLDFRSEVARTIYQHCLDALIDKRS
jgi:hypothetical protein